MIKLINTESQEFAGWFSNFSRPVFSGTAEDISISVADIIKTVKSKGDAVLIEYTARFDRLDLSTPSNITATEANSSIKISDKEINLASENVSVELLEALEIAAQRILSFHEKTIPNGLEYEDEVGATLGLRWTALDSVGIYVPGGTASYPSSVLMNAIPAKVAGVKRIAMVTPTPDGYMNPAVLVAAKIAGVSEIYRIGGAQSIAALCYGTETIKPVDKIVGPGNAYVAEAKRQVYGHVDIDSIAGPTDVTIIADKNANPEWIAADMLAQAEHGVDSRATLLTDSKELAVEVQNEIESQLQKLSRKEIAIRSIAEQSAIIICSDLNQAAELSNVIAPEHLQIMANNPRKLLPQIRHAGAIFLGAYSAESYGDYIAGPSHVLPTSATARFSSGLGVHDFMKRNSIIELSKEAALTLKNPARLIAESESLTAHANSLAIRE